MKTIRIEQTGNDEMGKIGYKKMMLEYALLNNDTIVLQSLFGISESQAEIIISTF